MLYLKVCLGRNVWKILAQGESERELYKKMEKDRKERKKPSIYKIEDEKGRVIITY